MEIITKEASVTEFERRFSAIMEIGRNAAD
jgi:hypothetical protein